MFATSRNTKESGFTLIELLTVIIIIGVLAAIVIPVFSAQRSRAQDSQTVSDVRNIVTAAETYLADRTKTPASIIDKSVLEYASAKNVHWDIKGNGVTNGYCIVAFNTSGKDYTSASKLLSYDSTAGGLKGSNGSCGPKDASGNMVAGAMRTDAGFTTVGTPAASGLGSTSVGSDTATGTLPAGATAMAVGAATTYNPTAAPTQTWVVPTTGSYTITSYGAQGGGYLYWSGDYYTVYGGTGGIVSANYNLTAGQNITLVPGTTGGFLNSYTSSGYFMGGGGGTFVYIAGQPQPLQVAGGGSGAYRGYYYSGGGNAATTTAGSGSGPTSNSSGASWTTNPSTASVSSGSNATGNWAGGTGSRSTVANGGVGGGGAGWSYTNSDEGMGGGGGGYTGGAAGAGGSNYISSTATSILSNTNTNNGAGKVTVTRLS